MPRTGRFTVEFTIPGNSKVWIAEFSHQHTMPERGTMPVRPLLWVADHGKDLGRTIEIQHLTIVRLRYKDAVTWLSGHAPCSLRDTYNWRKGLHYAMQRALEKGGFCRLMKENGRVVVVAKRSSASGAIYDQVMTAFWREMTVRPDDSVEKPVDESGASFTKEQRLMLITTALGPYISSSRPGVPHSLGATEEA